MSSALDQALAHRPTGCLERKPAILSFHTQRVKERFEAQMRADRSAALDEKRRFAWTAGLELGARFSREPNRAEEAQGPLLTHW